MLHIPLKLFLFLLRVSNNITRLIGVFVCLCLNGIFVPQNQPASALGSTLLRCDKLDQAEIKSFLMCFLHVLKSMSEGNISLLLILFEYPSSLFFCLILKHLAQPHVCNTKKWKLFLNCQSRLFQMLCSHTGTRLQPQI